MAAETKETFEDLAAEAKSEMTETAETAVAKPKRKTVEAKV